MEKTELKPNMSSFSRQPADLQSLQDNQRSELHKILLTASGGPFRGKTLEELKLDEYKIYSELFDESIYEKIAELKDELMDSVSTILFFHSRFKNQKNLDSQMKNVINIFITMPTALSIISILKN